MLRGFKIKSNLSEKQIEADIATYLGWISPGGSLPFRLIDIDEQVTGADKMFNHVIPVYMQFKVSEGLRPAKAPGFIYPKTPLHHIRRYRRNHGLADDPTFYFKLRDRADNAEDFQHNILLKLNNTSNARAFYVAPLLFDKEIYFNNLCNPAVSSMPDPFYYRNIALYDKAWISYIGMIPLLRGHVSIPPMERVTHSHHYYSFSENGDDIAFHSPSRVTGINRLSDNLQRIFSARNGVNTERFLADLRENFDWFKEVDDNNYYGLLQRIQNFGKELYARTEIRQFLFLSNHQTPEKHFDS